MSLESVLVDSAYANGVIAASGGGVMFLWCCGGEPIHRHHQRQHCKTHITHTVRGVYKRV